MGVVAMGQSYGQLSLEERIEIYRLHAGGRSRRAIAAALGRAPSTVSRELRRNGQPTKVWRGGYAPVRADGLAKARRRSDKRFKLARQPDLRRLVKNGLAMGLSPEQIAGRLTREHGRTCISHESIYRYVYHRSANKDYWHRLLPRRKSRRGRFGIRGGSPASFIKHRRAIAERPAEVAGRAVPGHWEADYMLFSRPGQALLVTQERSSRLTLIAHPSDRKAHNTASHLIRMLEPVPPPLRKSLTFDNGTEFALHYRLTEQLGIETFFCNTHAPWQKGGVENAIGRLRRILPRKTNLDDIEPQRIQQIVAAYNNTPRKCLDFLTPAEVFSAISSTVALQT
jgi:IS30 family transposase